MSGIDCYETIDCQPCVGKLDLAEVLTYLDDEQQQEDDGLQLLLELELTNSVDSSYLERRAAAAGAAAAPGCASCGARAPPRLTAGGRADAVNWMSDAALTAGLGTDALFLAVGLLDRFLASPAACGGACGGSSGAAARAGGGSPAVGCCGFGDFEPGRPELLLLAAACIWVAAKYEHGSWAPGLEVFRVAVLGGRFTTEDLRAMEARLLAAVDYRLASIVTPKAFLRVAFHRLAASEAARGSKVAEDLYFTTAYIAECALLEYGLLAFRPSEVAAAALALAHALLGRSPAGGLARWAGYGAEAVAEPLRWLRHVHAMVSQAGGRAVPYSATVKYLNPAAAFASAVLPLVSSADTRLAAHPAAAGGGGAAPMACTPAAAPAPATAPGRREGEARLKSQRL
ncbi:MAG: hypothetical protein J3K34DRAFT_477235 [Monoraphidium minutum]|nr:MAG: hypothetical protein J3K34DRAFT_477235 [Monoraphidium minutum]